MCKKQTSVSHSFNRIRDHLSGHRTEIGWFACPGIVGSDCLWFLDIFLIFQIEQEKPVIDGHKHHKSHNKIDVMQDIDSVPSSVQSASQEVLLYVFEDNEAVIKMIMKGRSPTVRHVSRSYRVGLDWLFDRINLDPKIQIKYIDIKNQLADILTTGNFTRDEVESFVEFV